MTKREENTQHRLLGEFAWSRMSPYMQGEYRRQAIAPTGSLSRLIKWAIYRIAVRRYVGRMLSPEGFYYCPGWNTQNWLRLRVILTGREA